jgi:phenylpyruvate tautomerase PptA (4-oxalocrotonate tautomerase family)
MPHVIVKLWHGKSERQEKKVADEMTKVVMSTGKPGTIYNTPGYDPL